MHGMVTKETLSDLPNFCATSHPEKATSDLSEARTLFLRITTLYLGECEIYSHWGATLLSEKTIQHESDLVGISM